MIEDGPFIPINPVKVVKVNSNIPKTIKKYDDANQKKIEKIIKLRNY